MSPAFSSTRQAAKFAIALAVLICLPAIVATTGAVDRRDVYPTIAWKYGPFPYIQQKIFDQSGDVDVVFLGSSNIWSAINATYVRQKFSEHLGRDAEVFTLGWPWAGFDALYVVARDLLEHRRVKVMVIYDESTGKDLPHPHASRWFLFGGDADARDGLAPRAQARLYASAVLGMPRHLLSLLRPNLLEVSDSLRPNFWHSYYRAPNIASQHGALRVRLAYNVSPDFSAFQPHGTASSSDFRFYSDKSREAFRITGPPPHQYDLHFASRLARLCHERGTRLVMLHTPALHEREANVINQRTYWPDALGAPVEMLGIPPARLYAGIPRDDVSRLFFEDRHLNANGQDMYTPLLTPALLDLYGRLHKQP